jgi:TolB-like protein
MRNRGLIPLTVLALSACGAGVEIPPVTPEDIPSLEAARTVKPRDPQLLTELGVAYFRDGRYDAARTTLRPVGTPPTDNFVATLYLALAHEELAQYDSARVLLQDLQTRSELSDAERDAVADHVERLTRLELREAARQAVAQESALSVLDPLPNTIAVFPWTYQGPDSSLKPLERGLAHLIVTDLGQVSQLRVLERTRVQALVDELALADSGRVDPGSAARSGRLLRAATVVHGTLQGAPAGGEELRLDATAVTTTSGQIVATAEADDRLQRLFDLEKAVVLQLIADLGITLTAAEREAISDRPTADLQAFLAFSRGLVREDAGLYRAAEAEFGAAASLEPSFLVAASRRDRAGRLAATGPGPEERLAADLQGSTDRVRRQSQTRTALLTSVRRTNPSKGGRIERLTRLGAPDKRRGIQEALLADDPRDAVRIGDIIIVIPRP